MQIFLQNMHANMQEKSTKYACFMQIFFNLKYSNIHGPAVLMAREEKGERAPKFLGVYRLCHPTPRIFL